MARTLTIPQREILKYHVSDLYLRGLSHRLIAENINNMGLGFTTSKSNVFNYVKTLLKEWKQHNEENIDAVVWANIEKYNKIEKEAWEAWERSKKEKVKKSTKQVGRPTGKDNVSTVSIVKNEETIQMIGDVRFLEMIEKCVSARLEWLDKLKFGIKSDASVNFNNTNNNINLQINVDYSRFPEHLRPKTIDMSTFGVNKEE